MYWYHGNDFIVWKQIVEPNGCSEFSEWISLLQSLELAPFTLLNEGDTAKNTEQNGNSIPESFYSLNG